MKDRFRSLNFLLIYLVAFTVFPGVYLHPIWSTVFCAVLLSYRAWIEYNMAPMPPRWLLLCGQIAAATAVWIQYTTIIGDEAAGTLLGLLACLKLFELKAKRDYFLSVILCFLSLMSLLLLSQSLLMTVFLIGDTVLLLSFMFILEGGTEMRSSLLSGFWLLLKALPLLILVFILFPRFSTGFGGNARTTGKMGIADQLRPGSISSLISSDELVFRATFLHGEMPPRQFLYWRGAVLNYSDGLNWDHRGVEVLDERVEPLSRQDVEVYLEPGYDRFLFSLENTSSLSFPNESAVRLKPGHVFELEQPLQTRERYLLKNEGTRPFESSDLSSYLQVSGPPSHELRNLLKQFRRSSVDSAVFDLMTYFQKGGYAYTLEPPPIADLDDFIFKSKSGFCEHYAGAMATLLRYLKIPSRVVVGFQGGTPSLLDRYVTVRSQDAHAWVEYYDPNSRRWHRADPTAQIDPQRIKMGGAIYLRELKGWMFFDKATAFFDEIDAAWTGFLLHFDLARQRDFLARLGMEGVLYRALPVFLILGIFLIASLIYFFDVNRVEHLSADEKLYRQLLQVLRRKHFEKQASEGPVQFFARIESTAPELAGVLSPIFGELILIRFGRKELTNEKFLELRSRIRRLGKQ